MVFALGCAKVAGFQLLIGQPHGMPTHLRAFAHRQSLPRTCRLFMSLIDRSSIGPSTEGQVGFGASGAAGSAWQLANGD